MRAVFTYGMICTTLGFAKTGYSEDVCHPNKESITSKDAIHHPMENTMEHSVHIQRSGKVDFLANHV